MRMRRAAAAVSAAAVGTALGATAAVAWGDDGHFLVNRSAALSLPTAVPAFFRDAVDQLTWLGADPDRWREDTEAALRAAQVPDHFVKLDPLGPGFVFPPDRFAFYARLEQMRAAAPDAATRTTLLPDQVGSQPYIVIELYDRLVVAFRQYRRLARGGRTDLVEGSAITWAGWMGHYVADAAQPHHTSKHYDGWLGSEANGYRREPGIHWFFENDFVQAHLDQLQVLDMVPEARSLEDPFQAYLDFIAESHGSLEDVYRIEAAGGFDVATRESLDFTRTRLLAASRMLRDLWYTAWVESGR